MVMVSDEDEDQKNPFGFETKLDGAEEEPEQETDPKNQERNSKEETSRSNNFSLAAERSAQEPQKTHKQTNIGQIKPDKISTNPTISRKKDSKEAIRNNTPWAKKHPIVALASVGATLVGVGGALTLSTMALAGPVSLPMMIGGMALVGAAGVAGAVYGAYKVSSGIYQWAKNGGLKKGFKSFSSMFKRGKNNSQNLDNISSSPTIRSSKNKVPSMSQNTPPTISPNPYVQRIVGKMQNSPRLNATSNDIPQRTNQKIVKGPTISVSDV